MPKLGRNVEFTRTYKEIIISFLKELNEKSKIQYDYDSLSQKEILEVLNILVQKCKTNIIPFMKHILGAEVYWFHKKWFENWKNYRYMCNVAPRGCGKTYFFTAIMPTWLAFAKPMYGKESKIFNEMIVAYNETEAKEFLGQVRKFVEENELLSNLVSSGANTDWNKLSLDMQNDVSVKARSFSGHLRGKHLKYMAVDDVLNDDSDVTPESMRTKLTGTVFPMLRRFRGKFNMVGTLFSEDDIYHYFEEKAQDPRNIKTKMYGFYKIFVELDIEEEKVYICEYDAMTGETIKYLDTGVTDIYDFDDLYISKEQEPITFAREYECKIVSDSDVPFPYDDLKACCDPKYSYKRLQPTAHNKYGSGLDSSNSMKKDSDSTVLMTGFHDGIENKYIVSDYYENNSNTVPDRIKEITKRLRYWNNSYCVAEKNSMGETSIQYLNENNGLNIKGQTTSRDNKIDMTDFASILVKKGNVIFPYATLGDKDRTDRIIAQLAGVVEKKTKRSGQKTYTGSTKHDDLYIGFILMLKALFEIRGKKASVKSYSRKELYADNTGWKDIDDKNLINEIKQSI